MPQTATPKEKTFDTIDVVALYLGKTFGNKHMPEIKKIVKLLIGTDDNFSFGNVAQMNQIRQLLDQKFSWLASVRYNRSDFENWKNNIIHNHGKELTLSK